MPIKSDRHEHKRETLTLENVVGTVTCGSTLDFFEAPPVSWHIEIRETSGDREFDHRPRESVTVAKGNSQKPFDEVVAFVKSHVQSTYDTLHGLSKLTI